MIVGIGCDIVEHSTTEALRWRSDTSLLKRIFSHKELDIYYDTEQLSFLCGRFAVKEAVMKCLKTGMADGFSLTDIHVLKDSLGMPVLELTGSLKEFSKNLNISFWHISITHTSNSSIAFVIAESHKI